MKGGTKPAVSRNPIKTTRPARGDLLKRIAAQMKRITVPNQKKR